MLSKSKNVDIAAPKPSVTVVKMLLRLWKLNKKLSPATRNSITSLSVTFINPTTKPNIPSTITAHVGTADALIMATTTAKISPIKKAHPPIFIFPPL